MRSKKIANPAPATVPIAIGNAAGLATITPGHVRQLLAETATRVLNGEITATEAKRINRDCARITRELNQRAAVAVRIARLARGSKR